MSSKVKGKKIKSKRSVSSACWIQNDDGTLSLSIGSKKSNSEAEFGDGPVPGLEVKMVHDHNGNLTMDSTLATPQPLQTALQPVQVDVSNKITTASATAPNSPITILKSKWLQNGFGYKERQQIKRRDEMTAERLDMVSIPTYQVPVEVWKAEESKEPLSLNFKAELCRKKHQHYHKGFKTMIHLEEAAQTLFMQTFDQTEVRIIYAGTGRIFFFLNEVENLRKNSLI